MSQHCRLAEHVSNLAHDDVQVVTRVHICGRVWLHLKLALPARGKNAGNGSRVLKVEPRSIAVSPCGVRSQLCRYEVVRVFGEDPGRVIAHGPLKRRADQVSARVGVRNPGSDHHPGC